MNPINRIDGTELDAVLFPLRGDDYVTSSLICVLDKYPCTCFLGGKITLNKNII
jgi:hypothetical protein